MQQFSRAATEDRSSESPRFDQINIERTQSSGWLYDVDHKLLAKISARLDLVTGLNVAKSDPVSIEEHPYGTFESEAYQASHQDHGPQRDVPEGYFGFVQAMSWV